MTQDNSGQCFPTALAKQGQTLASSLAFQHAATQDTETQYLHTEELRKSKTNQKTHLY